MPSDRFYVRAELISWRWIQLWGVFCLSAFLYVFVFSSRLVELLKMAVKSEKKDRTLPSVGLDLMKVALAEGTFELFWKEAVENGLLKEKDGPSRFVGKLPIDFSL